MKSPRPNKDDTSSPKNEHHAPTKKQTTQTISKLNILRTSREQKQKNKQQELKFFEELLHFTI